MAAGKRFCSTCGTPVAAPATNDESTVAFHPVAAPGYQRSGSPPPPAPRPIPAAAAPAAPAFHRQTPLLLAAAAGFGAAIVATFLDWIAARGAGANAWVSHRLQYQISDALNATVPIDAILVIAVGVFGVLLVVGPILLMKRGAAAATLATIAGLALGALGVIEVLYIRDLNKQFKTAGFPVSLDPGVGLFVLVAAGAVAALCGIVAARRSAQPRATP